MTWSISRRECCGAAPGDAATPRFCAAQPWPQVNSLVSSKSALPLEYYRRGARGGAGVGASPDAPNAPSLRRRHRPRQTQPAVLPAHQDREQRRKPGRGAARRPNLQQFVPGERGGGGSVAAVLLAPLTPVRAQMQMRHDESCKVQCKLTLNAGQARDFSERIEDEYRVTMRVFY